MQMISELLHQEIILASGHYLAIRVPRILAFEHLNLNARPLEALRWEGRI